MENSTLILALMTVSEPYSIGYLRHLAEHASLDQTRPCGEVQYLRNPQSATYRKGKMRGQEHGQPT